MTPHEPERAPSRASRRFRRLLPAAVVLVVTLAAALVVIKLTAPQQAPTSPLPLLAAGEVELPGGSSRFDYASLDADRGLLFIAHLGDSEVLEVDIRAHRVVRTIPNLSQVHGVLVVPALHRVY